MDEFINLTNHPSANWSDKQKEAAREYGIIVDLPFPAVNSGWSDEELDRTVRQYREKICARGHPVVLLQGDYVFTFRLTNLLKEAGIRVVAACSERQTVERTTESGLTEKISRFEFQRFREY